MDADLSGKTVLVTGAARRVGRALALSLARAGADVIIHYGSSGDEAESARAEIEALGRRAFLLQADLADPSQAAGLVARATECAKRAGLFALVNSAAIFEPLDWDQTTLEDWNRHLTVNLTAPFLLSQAFARALAAGEAGRIVNILDWRALRPGADHLPYTISKSALAALTRSLAVALAPRITVNGLALGAVLPPSDGGGADVLADVPARRWAELDEVGQALVFLLAGPAYVTGEILHVDGGRHLV
jgi:NAD(P)-dependent dehydrogenase (short-subunit alcohol dehydrogenase family)